MSKTILPSQTGAAGKFLKSDGTDATFETIEQSDVSGLGTSLDSKADLTYVDAQLAEIENEKTKYIPKITNLMFSNVYAHPTFNTVEDDYVNYKKSGKGLKINAIGSTAFLVEFIPPVPLELPKTSTIGVWVYINDVSKVGSFAVNIYTKSDFTEFSSFDLSIFKTTLKNGWNLLRGNTTRPSTPFVNQIIYKIRITGLNSSPTWLTIGNIWAESPPKAQILFIDDGAYPEFLQNGYPSLKQRGIPVTWAIAPGRIGGTNHITEQEIFELSQENNNSISFHSWNVSPTSTMTSEELRADCYNTLKWLRERGYNGGRFRAAWTQNLAQNHASTQKMFYAYPMWGTGGGLNESFPFTDRFNVNRRILHAFNDNPTGLANVFDLIKKTNSLLVIYTHKVVDVPTSVDTTTERWNQFLALIDAGLTEGWLEGVTFDMLLERTGTESKPSDGDWVRELFEDENAYGSLKLIK